MKSHQKLFVILILVCSVPCFAGDMFDVLGKDPVKLAIEPAAPEIGKPEAIPAPQFLFEDPTHQIIMKELMALVVADLKLALQALDGKGSCFWKPIPALGHMNKAAFTLAKVNPPKPHRKIIWEIQKRLFSAKFYVLMHNFDEGKARVQALVDFIGTLG